MKIRGFVVSAGCRKTAAGSRRERSGKAGPAGEDGRARGPEGRLERRIEVLTADLVQPTVIVYAWVLEFRLSRS